MSNRESIRKILNVRKALYPTLNFVVMIGISMLALFMGGVSVYFTLISSKWAGGEFIFIFNMLFLSVFAYALLSVISAQPSEKMKAYVKSNQLLINELQVFPITKRDCIRASFESWAKTMLIPVVTFLALNIPVAVSDSFAEREGYIGFSTVISIVVLLFVEHDFIICSCNKKRNKTLAMFVYFVLYMGLFTFATFFSESKMIINFYDYFKPIAGIIGIIITISFIPLSYILTNFLLLKNKKSEAWHNE